MKINISILIFPTMNFLVIYSYLDLFILNIINISIYFFDNNTINIIMSHYPNRKLCNISEEFVPCFNLYLACATHQTIGRSCRDPSRKKPTIVYVDTDSVILKEREPIFINPSTMASISFHRGLQEIVDNKFIPSFTPNGKRCYNIIIEVSSNHHPLRTISCHLPNPFIDRLLITKRFRRSPKKRYISSELLQQRRVHMDYILNISSLPSSGNLTMSQYNTNSSDQQEPVNILLPPSLYNYIYMSQGNTPQVALSPSHGENQQECNNVMFRPSLYRSYQDDQERLSQSMENPPSSFNKTRSSPPHIVNTNVDIPKECLFQTPGQGYMPVHPVTPATTISSQYLTFGSLEDLIAAKNLMTSLVQSKEQQDPPLSQDCNIPIEEVD